LKTKSLQGHFQGFAKFGWNFAKVQICGKNLFHNFFHRFSLVFCTLLAFKSAKEKDPENGVFLE
jgi:hypothetical protein